MNEFQAVVGLKQLEYFESNKKKRRDIYLRYGNFINRIEGIDYMKTDKVFDWNYSYFPIFVSDKFQKTRDELYDILKENNIYSRKYFYPLISDFPTYRGLDSAKTDNLPIAKKVAKSVLCLPIFSDMEIENVDLICNVIQNA